MGLGERPCCVFSKEWACEGQRTSKSLPSWLCDVRQVTLPLWAQELGSPAPLLVSSHP